MAQQLCQCQLTVVRFFPTAMSTALVRHQLKKLEYTHQLATGTRDLAKSCCVTALITL